MPRGQEGHTVTGPGKGNKHRWCGGASGVGCQCDKQTDCGPGKQDAGLSRELGRGGLGMQRAASGQLKPGEDDMPFASHQGEALICGLKGMP